jgi:two-component system OmpR family response regulator
MNSRGICLVIEDDLDIRDLLCLILSGAGFEVHAEATGAAGLRAAKRLNLTLITLDLGLPDLDGHDVARQLRTLSTAPLLMITAYAEPDDELGGWSPAPTHTYPSPSGPPSCGRSYKSSARHRLSPFPRRDRKVQGKPLMPNPSTLAFGLTYAGTLAVALLMLLGQLAAFTALLAIIGTARLLVVSVRALMRPRPD